MDTDHRPNFIESVEALVGSVGFIDVATSALVGRLNDAATELRAHHFDDDGATIDDDGATAAGHTHEL